MSLAPAFHRLRIADRRQETADCVSLAFAVPHALRDIYRFEPGQYLTLRNEADIRRPYSICAGPDDGELRVAIKRVPGGRFSEWATTSLAAGDSIDVMTPQGRFGVGILDDGQTYAAFAAGSGITPILSFLRAVMGREKRSRFLLFLGNRTAADIIFRDAIEDLKDRHLSRLSVFHVLSREQRDLALPGRRVDAEFVHDILPTLIPVSAIDHALVCGPAGMGASVPDALRELGLPAARIHVERFLPAPEARTAIPRAGVPPEEPPRAMVTAIQGGRRLEFPVRGADALIDAAAHAGIELPYSCKGGMCCTCRAKLLEGTVEMAANYSLEPWELEAGFVLTCQSRPTSARVVVDYDQM